ncbi:MAG: sensor histidine kinase [Deltaproteobacteria bacterium]|nr:sensor histidine kinase [Deltaproteobacteria bacterium]
MTEPQEPRAPSVSPSWVAARLRPLLTLFGVLLALGAPLAHHTVGARELRQRCDTVATQAAVLLSQEAQERPVLWRYDSIKLLAHLRAYRVQPAVAWVRVLDPVGRPIEQRVQQDLGPVLWCSHEVQARSVVVGQVWVAMDLRVLRRSSLGLLALFALVGLSLGMTVYALVLRSIRAAVRRIDALVAALESSNVSLEKTVAHRTEALEHALFALHNTTARALALQEQERRAIGRDLHDSVGQALTAVRIHGQLAAQRASADAGQTQLLDKLLHTTDSAIEELRRALSRLAPALLGELGLVGAARRTLDDLAALAGLTVHESMASELALPPAIELVVFRTVQECSTNVLRHAGAKNVWISLAMIENSQAIRLVFEDDGVGVALGDSSPARFGLSAMRERAALLRGKLEIARRDEGGTRLSLEIPVDSVVQNLGDGERGDGPR